MSHTTRLIVVTHEFHPHRGGIAVYTGEMAAAAAALGYEVEVWAPALPAGQTDPARPYRVRRLAVTNSHSLWNQWNTARLLRAERARLAEAILYVPEPGPLLSLQLLQLLGSLPRTRMMVTFHGSEIVKLAARPLTRWSTARLLTQAARISVVSGHARDLLAEFFPRASTKVVLTQGALRADFQAAATVLPGNGIADRIVILTVARLHPRKGQLRMIEALQALPPALKSRAEYWIVGSHGKARYERALRSAAARAGVPVRFLGDVSDDQLGEIYRQAHVFAMTSLPYQFSVEGFGLVYLEAGAHGLPVLAHAIGGVPEAVVHDETGLLVPPDDLPALTQALARLVAEAPLRRRLGDAGRTRAGRHTWRQNALTLFGQPASHPPM